MEHLWQDIRYGARQLLNQRTFTIIAVLTLALGIGANVAIFNVLDAVLLKQLPVERPEEIYLVHSDKSGNTSFSNPLWEQVRDRQDVFSGVFAWSIPTFNLSRGGEVRNVRGMWASGQLFSTLGVRPQIGRLLTVEDDRKGGTNNVAVLGHSFWQREYGGAGDVVGREIYLDGHAFQIVGVAPKHFTGLVVGHQFDVVVPIAAEKIIRGENSSLEKPTHWWLNVAGRLKTGMTPAQADAGLAVISPEAFRATVRPTAQEPYRTEYMSRIFKASPASTGTSTIRRRYQQALYLLMGIVGLVLLIACANIANLLLARATVRQKEMGVRLALGASRRRLIQQLLTESLLIAVAGTTLAAPLASLAGDFLLAQIGTSTSTVFLQLAPDWRVLAFVAGLAVLTTVLFGLAPAFRATRVTLSESMKQAGPGPAEGRGRFGLGRIIVVAQVAISLVLVGGAALLLRTFHNLTSADTGFEASRVLIAELNVRRLQATPEARAVLYDQIVERLRAVPGVAVASQAGITPVSGSAWNDDVNVPGYVSKGRGDSVSYFNDVAPHYFAALGTQLIAGREFTPQDAKNAPKVAIVNEAFVAKFMPGRNPVGTQFFQGEDGPKRVTFEIVGFVKNAKYQRIREEPLPTVYVPLAQGDAATSTNIVVRSSAEPRALIAQVRAAIEDLSPQAAIRFTTLETQVADSLRQDRLLAMLSGFFGALALLLSAMGLYGLLAHSVARRRREIGIRMALGSTPQMILRLILSDGMRLVIFGLVLGTAGTFAATRVLSTFLYGVKERDPLTLTFAGMVLVAIAVSACAGAARRAARIEPYSAIRYE